MARGISVVISGSAAPLRKAIQEATNALGGMSKGSTLAFGAAATATTMFAKAAVQAAADDQKQQALLAQTLKNTTGATAAQVAAVENLIGAMQTQVAFTDTELRAAYQSLAVGTGSLTEAQKLLTLTLDVSSATGRDAKSVADALSRGYAGNMRALATLSPEVKKAIKDGADFSEVVKILADNFGGSAAVEAGTFSGQMEILRNQVDEAKESIGNALLPALAALVPAAKEVAIFIGQNAGIIGGFAVALGGLATTVLVAKVALATWNAIGVITTAVNWALATSFTAVQVATGVGIATAIAGAAAFVAITAKMRAQREETDKLTLSINALNTGLQATPVFGAGFALALNTITAIEKDQEDRRKKNAEAEAKRYKAFQDNLKKAKQALREYVDGIRDSIASTVTLQSAFATASQEQADATADLNDALRERKDAYTALDQARVTNDVNAYNDALKRVATAETAVTAAQAVKPRTYGEIFREQVAAAKEFAGNLKKLIAAGLGKAGLAQILDLGPVAGNAVAKDLLAGTGGLTVAGLNADLASVMAEAGTVGLAFPGVQAALTATAGKGANNTYQITVQAGVGDPAEIAKQVVEVLKTYNSRFGKIPIKVG